MTAPFTTSEQRRELLESVIPLAYSLAGKFSQDHETILELAQEVMTGFGKAATRFDPDRGNKFVTYAYRAGMQAASRYMRQRRGHGMKVPVNGRVDVPSSIQFSQTGIDGVPFEQTIPDREHHVPPDPAIVWSMVIANLHPRHRDVLVWSFRDGMTFKEIGRRLGVSKARAAQISQEAIERLRKLEFVAENLSEE